MARLQEIFETINSKLPSYNSAFTKICGLAMPVDTVLRGKLRFAKKLGFPVPIWLPDNLTTTSQDATIINNFLYVTTPLYVSEYGKKNERENFADAFAYYLLGLELPDEIKVIMENLK